VRDLFPDRPHHGDATIDGVQGQGILLIDGSLSVQGGFQWFGITIIQGQLKTSGGGSTDAHFWGATMVHDSVSFGTNTLSGHANINYSQCAVLKVLNATAKGALMRSRSWCSCTKALKTGRPHALRAGTTRSPPFCFR